MKQPELGKKIVELRKAKGLTQEELVEKCNLNVRTLQRIESGEVTPRSYTIKIIFTALGYTLNNSPEMAQRKFSMAGFTFIPRLEQLYKYLIDLFNLKTNTMRKISILSFVLLLIVFSAFYFIVRPGSGNSNPLIGKWRLVGIAKESFSLNDGATYVEPMMSVDNSETRILEFKSDSSFETRTLQNSIYNSGAYSVLGDASFITVHLEPNRELSTVSNLYRFQVASDTLHFAGFYMAKAPQFGENFYEKKFIDEWWVKIKK